MDRFVAMVWDDEDQSQRSRVNAWSEALQRQSPRWLKTLDAPGLCILSYRHRGDAPVTATWESEDGLIIGALFERGHEANGRIQRLGTSEAAHVASSAGDYLVAKYWGNYVALWRNRANRMTTVLRDPCGAVPCFVTRQLGLTLLFAHPQDIACLSGLSFTVDWTYLQSFLLYERFVTRKTGLQEVEELLPGERMELAPDDDIKLCWAWNGAEIAAQPSSRSFEDIKQELRETAEACFTAWGKEYRNMLVTLSGGLDSSIVVNLLRRVSDARITALHYVGSGYEEYEIRLARLAAARAGVELIEVRPDLAKEDLHPLLELPRFARPATGTLALLADQIGIGVANRIGADCFINGQAGDTLFLQHGITRQMSADCLRLDGLGPAFGRVAYDSAMLQQTSIWSAIGGAFTRRHGQPYAFLDEPEAVRSRALAPAAAAALPETYRRHPWMDDAASLPPGKAQHLGSIVALSRFHPVRGHALAYDVISSFYCQPIVELVLRTPTYRLCKGGLDRALERHAFADLIPKEIMRRTAKGGINVAAWQGIRANLDFLRTMILDGALVKQGWLDQAKIERTLSDDGVTRGESIFLIYQLAAAEAWLHAWRAPDARAAA